MVLFYFVIIGGCINPPLYSCIDYERIKYESNTI